MAIQNSVGKVFQAGKSYSRSLGLIGRFTMDIDEGNLYARLVDLGKRLTEAPETSDLEPIFKIEREIGPKVEKFARAKSETAALGRFQRASEQLLRFADKMEDGTALVERMQLVSELDLTKVADLQPIFALCDEVFAAVGDFQNGEIVRKIDRVLKGWLTAKTGEAGRYSEAFLSTEAYKMALSWKTIKPLASADYRALKEWRNAGYELLKGELDHPWGMCPTCKTNKLMPWKNKSEEWVPNSLCRDCYAAQPVKVSTSSGSGKKKGKVLEFRAEPLTLEQIEANRVAARALNEANRLAKKNKRRANAETSAGKSQKHEDGALKSIRKQEKEERKQGSHPGEKGKDKKKAGATKKKASLEAK